jgi:hypothetical protein
MSSPGNPLQKIGSILEASAKGFEGKSSKAPAAGAPAAGAPAAGAAPTAPKSPVEKIGSALGKGVHKVAHKLNNQFGHTPYSLATDARSSSSPSSSSNTGSSPSEDLQDE